MKRNRLLLGMLTWLAWAAPLAAGEWPRFRGPDGLGISRDAPPPLTWSESENLVWKTELPGPGSSSPIVWGDRVFVTCYSGYGLTQGVGSTRDLKRHLLCVERATGQIKWQVAENAVTPELTFQGFLTEHGYASSTPVTDGERVYVFFGKSGVLAYDMDGRSLWKTSVGTGSDPRQWGSGASPVLYKDTVIVNAVAESETIFALNKETGKEVWRADAGGAANSWSTPIFVPAPDETVEMILLVPDEIWGLNPENGKLRWYAQADMQPPVCPSAVAENGVAFGVGGRQTGSAAVRVGGKGDVTQTHRLWTSRASSYVPSPLVQDGKWYCVNDRGVALCVDANSGEILYQERLRSQTPQLNCYASVVLAGDRLYAVSRRAGTFVLAAGARFEQLAQNRFASDASDFNGSPALSDGQIFLRSNRFLYCVGPQ